MTEYGPDYRLLWPAALFQEETRAIADVFNSGAMDDQARLLFTEVFAGPAPLRDLSTAGPLGDAWSSLSDGRVRNFLLTVANDAPQFPTRPRHYWRRRQQPEPSPEVLSPLDLQTAWAMLVADLDSNGYLDAVVPSACLDGSTEEERNEELGGRLSDEAGCAVIWPISVPEDGLPEEYFFTLVELIHDMIARPRRRSFHDFGNDWHWYDFASRPGKRLYRWKVNELFGRSPIHLELADEGSDEGFLVLAARDGREDLVQRTVERAGTVEIDPVARAVFQFRDRNADRIQKRSACVLLANELEQERGRVQENLLSKDEGMLFQIANQFAIRHQRADQHADYDDAYLDWVFWMYLATVELMRVLADRK